MIHDIVIYGDPVLREKCALVETITDETRALAGDMLETMVAANGVGLAAPQIGVPIQLAVIDVSHDPECVSYLRIDGEEADLADWMPLVFVNPLLQFGKERDTDTEGCLSFPELRAEIRRPYDVRATMTLIDGRTITLETDGLLARAIQHETDHLNGVLFIDRLSSAAKLGMRKKVRSMQEEYGLRLKLDPPKQAKAPEEAQSPTD